jgi:hypothetical protein
MNDEPKSIHESALKNTDKIVWQSREGDYYAHSIHVTEAGGIGINCGGHVIVMPVEKWHALGQLRVLLDSLLK